MVDLSIHEPPFRTLRVEAGERSFTTVVDSGYVRVEAADSFLRAVALSPRRSPSSTKPYAHGLVIYLNWCAETRRLDLAAAARDHTRFLAYLQTTAIQRLGRGHGSIRCNKQINQIALAVRGMYRHCAVEGPMPASVLQHLFEIAEDHRPVQARGEGPHLTHIVRPRHVLPMEKSDTPDAAPLEVIDAMIEVATLWRDRLLVMVLFHLGLRVGEALNLRVHDLHLFIDEPSICRAERTPHLHVVPRVGNENGSEVKSEYSRLMPVNHLVIGYFDRYWAERAEALTVARRTHPDHETDYLFVNTARAPFGDPMKVGRARKIITKLGARALADKRITPHQLRHAAGTLWAKEHGIAVAQELLGHRHLTSTQRYVHVDESAKRAAAAAGAAALRRIREGT